MAAETKRPRLGALHSVEAGLHMHQRAQAKRAAVRGRNGDPDAVRGYLCGPALTFPARINALHRRGGRTSWGVSWRRAADRVFGVSANARWVRRVGLGIGGYAHGVPAGRRRAVVAPVERPDLPRHRSRHG